MATPTPFNAPRGSFAPRFSPQGLLQRSQIQAAADADVARRAIQSLAKSSNPLLGALGKVGRFAGPLGEAAAIIPVAQSVFNPKDNIITATQNLVTSVQNQFKPPGERSLYVGSDPFVQRRNAEIEAAKRPSGFTTYGTVIQPGVGEFDIATGRPTTTPSTAPLVIPPPDTTRFAADTTRFAASERNYEAEKERARQLAEQDQLAKKYQVADLTKAYNTAKTPEEKEKLGLQIWATTNPQLAQKLKPGQLGYTEAVSAFQSSSPLGTFTKSAGDMAFANKISFPSEPVAGAFNLQTPISGIELPENLKQVGVAETFAGMSPQTTQAMQSVFTEPLKFFKPDLTQTQQALLKQAFEKGLK